MEIDEEIEKTIKYSEMDAEKEVAPNILVKQTNELIKQNKRLGYLTMVLIVLTIIWIILTILTQL